MFVSNSNSHIISRSIVRYRLQHMPTATAHFARPSSVPNSVLILLLFLFSVLFKWLNWKAACETAYKWHDAIRRTQMKRKKRRTKRVQEIKKNWEKCAEHVKIKLTLMANYNGNTCATPRKFVCTSVRWAGGSNTLSTRRCETFAFIFQIKCCSLFFTQNLLPLCRSLAVSLSTTIPSRLAVSGEQPRVCKQQIRNWFLDECQLPWSIEIRAFSFENRNKINKSAEKVFENRILLRQRTRFIVVSIDRRII